MKISRGITGIWQIAQNKNVSTAVPLVMRFFLPPTAYGIHHLPLSYSVQDFETYSAVTAAGDPHSHSVTVPSHTHASTLWNYIASKDFYILGIQETSTTSELAVNGSVSHSTVSSDSGGGSAETSSSDSTHTHQISPSLGTVAADCTSIGVSVDGIDRTAALQARYGTLPITDASDLDVYTYLQAPILNGWHEVTITPQGANTPSGMCYIYAYLSPEIVIKEV